MPGTELPSPRRLNEARRRGDVPVSRRLNAVSGAIGALACLPWTLPATLEAFRTLLRSSLQSASAGHPSAALSELLAPPCWELLHWTLVPLGVGACFSVTMGLIQTRGLFAPRALTPQSARLLTSAPLDAARNLNELGLRVLGTATLLPFLLLLLLSYLPDAGNALWQVSASSGLIVALSWRLLWLAIAVNVALGVVEGVILRIRWLERLRMTRRELWREWQEQHPGTKLTR